MNKKGIIALVVIVALAIVAYVAFGKDDAAVVNNGENNSTSTAPVSGSKDDYAPVTSASTDTTLIGRLKKASVGVTEDGKKVALSNGTATFTIDGTTEKATVTLGSIAVEQVANGRKDILATVTVSQAKGVYTYVVLFEDKAGVLTDKSYGLVGERVNVTGIRADAVAQSGDVEYVATVSYMDRKAGEPTTATPSVAKSKFFIVEKGMFNLAKTIEL